MEGKKLSKPLRSFTIALVEVVPLLIFSQLDFCFPACLLWSPVIREASASLRAVKVALESNATPCSAMIKGTQVRQPQRHIQLASKKVSRLPSHPSFPPAFLSPDYSDTERRTWSTLIRIKQSDQVLKMWGEVCSRQKLLDKGNSGIEVRALDKGTLKTLHKFFFGL